jgi:hypothetical protein
MFGQVERHADTFQDTLRHPAESQLQFLPDNLRKLRLARRLLGKLSNLIRIAVEHNT